MKDYGITPLPDDTVVAMAYVPFQPYAPDTCQPALGYENGTMFRDLNKPFYGKKCKGDNK